MSSGSKAAEVLKAIRVFDVAKEGDSGDAELEAALDMKETMLDYLRSNPERTIELAELMDAFDAETERLQDEDNADESEEREGLMAFLSSITPRHPAGEPG